MRPSNPIHPGEMLLEEFLAPMKKAQREFAADLGWTPAKLNELIAHRHERERQIVELLARSPCSVEQVVAGRQAREGGSCRVRQAPATRAQEAKNSAVLCPLDDVQRRDGPLKNASGAHVAACRTLPTDSGPHGWLVLLVAIITGCAVY